MFEVAKSVFGFVSAVSMFGVQQAGKLFAGGSGQPAATTAAEIEEVSRAIQSHLTGAYATQFRVGDEWQRRLIDALFGAPGTPALDPRQVASVFDPRPFMDAADPRPIIETSVSVVRRSAEIMKQSIDSIARTVVPAGTAAAPNSTPGADN
jgi:hypothetical protein